MKRVIIPVILGLFLQPVHAATSVAVSQLAANGVSQSEAEPVNRDETLFVTA